MFFWPLGIPWEKAYSYFIISDEDWAFSVISVERYANTATKPFFQFFFNFEKSYFKLWGVKKATFSRTKS